MREIPIGKLDVLDSHCIGDAGVLFECRVREGYVIDTANLRGIAQTCQVVEARVLSLHAQPPHVFDLSVTSPRVNRGSTLWVRLAKDTRLVWPPGFIPSGGLSGQPPHEVDYFEVYEVVDP